MLSTQLDLLKGLPQEEAERVMQLASRISIPSGGELFTLGAAADHLYVIERGRIRLTLPLLVRGSQEDLLVEERMPGQTVGWSALIPPYRFTLKATAPLDTDVVALPRRGLIEHFAANPETGYAVALNVASVIGQRLQVFQTMWVREMQRLVEVRCA